MAYDKKLGFDPDTNLSAAAELSAKMGDTEAAQKYTDQYNQKVKNLGYEPTMYGSDKTYTQLKESGDQKTINTALESFLKNNNFNVTTTGKPSSGGSGVDAMLGSLMNRPAFSYDLEADPLYQQYKKQYQLEGQRAMNDTLAAAASNAGGMNSYAVSAAQQANSYYNAQLNNVIPELYNLAYSMYLDDYNQDVQTLGLMMDRENTEYQRGLDTRNFLYQLTRDDVSDQMLRDQFDFQKETTEWDQRHTLDREKVDDEWRQKTFDASNSQFWAGHNLSVDQEKRLANSAALQQAAALLEAGVELDANALKSMGLTEEQVEMLVGADATGDPKRDENGVSNIAKAWYTDLYKYYGSQEDRLDAIEKEWNGGNSNWMTEDDYKYLVEKLGLL